MTSPKIVEGKSDSVEEVVLSVTILCHRFLCSKAICMLKVSNSGSDGMRLN